MLFVLDERDFLFSPHRSLADLLNGQALDVSFLKTQNSSGTSDFIKLWIKRYTAVSGAMPVKSEIITAPVSGEVIGLEQVNDGVFSSKFMGEGAAIVPEDGNIFSPCKGIVIATAPTGYAYGLKSAGGAEILVHIGIDTVELNGAYFKGFVRKGQSVAKGDRIACFLLQMVRANHLDPVVIVIVTNSAAYASVERIKQKHVNVGSKLLILKAGLNTCNQSEVL